MAPPLSNRNAVRHGLKAAALPKGCSWIRRDCDELRRVIESEVARMHDGDVSVYHASVINTMIKWERHGMLVARWLRMESESMDHATRLAYSRDVAKAATERDKCLRELGLDRNAATDALTALYCHPSDEEQSNDDE